MATLIYPAHSKIHPNKLVEELPLRLKALRQIHDVNYGLLISSLIITAVLMALAWMVAGNRIHSYTEPSPWSTIATVAPYGAVNTIQDQLSETRSR